MTQPVITRETDDLAVDLTVVPLDGRIAADPLYEEEIDLLAQVNDGVGRSSSTLWSPGGSSGIPVGTSGISGFDAK